MTPPLVTTIRQFILTLILIMFLYGITSGKGGKNRRRGKGDGEESKRELEFKEDGTSKLSLIVCYQGSVSVL